MKTSTKSILGGRVEIIGPAECVDAVASHIETTITPQASAVAPLAPRLEDEAPAGCFAIMAGWKSYEIQHWLDTTTTPNARALFESGAALERDHDELRAALEICIHAVDLALCGTPSAHYFNDLKQRLGAKGYTLEDNLKLNMADIKGACTEAHKAARAALAKAKGGGL